MKRTTLSLCAAAVFALPLVLSGDTVTLPAVTSLPVGSAASPFFSDVRVFNTSYTGSVSVTAVYRCFIPQGCSAAGRQASFVLGPRESQAFDDMIFAKFNAPATAGAVEFTSSGDSVRVTSRLYSPESAARLATGVAGGTNGMFIPGMKVSQAHAVSVLTGLSNGLFRTNIGVYNGNDSGVAATIKLYNGGVLLGVLGPQQVPALALGPRSGTQISRIFEVLGQGGLVTTNAHAVVESSSASAPLFTYAAVIDNATSDSSFVAGDEDVPPLTGPVATATSLPPVPTPTPTRTPTAPAATPTPTPTPGSSTTVVQLLAVQFQWIFDGGGSNFVARVGQTYELHMRADDVQHGFGGIPELGLGGVTLNPGSAPAVRTFTPTSAQIGTHSFTCSISCGVGHPFDGAIQVVP